MLKQLTRIRPSNLVILAVLPFVIYLFTMVPNYRRSITAIVGIEDGAAALLTNFLLILVTLLAGLIWPVLHIRGRDRTPWGRRLSLAGIAASVALPVLLANFADLTPLANSIVANMVDPVQSDLVVKAVTPRRLTPEAIVMVAASLKTLLWALAAASAALGLAAAAAILAANQALALWASRLSVLVFGAALLFFLLGAHLGFASGLFTTLRAGIAAYLLAAFMGLCWAGLLRVPLKPSTIRTYGAAAALAVAASIILFNLPHTTYVLAGSLEKKVAIIRGTPKSLVDTIRFGQFDATLADKGEIGLRSSATPEQAIKLLQQGDEVSAVFLPADAVPQGVPELWRVSFLPDAYQTPAVFLMVGGILLGLLTFSAYSHQRHPLSVSAEFFIDTVRGIPMLVIILFVGLPFAGAVKDASGGVIDMPNVVRGVIAVSIGYSAYLAEIFRAGIDAVPKGQIEAARSMGLNNWQVARLVVLPQAFKIVIPALGNEFIAILKDTSLLSILSVRDVTQRMREFQSASFLPFAPFNSAAILYVFLTLAAASLIASIERKFDVKHR
jgi:polar amino acid transport system permease protein